jgi:tRNA(Arg) A34 adenosine deaminase TadA
VGAEDQDTSSELADRRFLERAVELADEGMRSGLGGPFGAVVVRSDEAIAEDCNQVTSANDPTAHAEIVAIRRACRTLDTFDLSGCVLYASTEPCPMCLGATRSCGLLDPSQRGGTGRFRRRALLSRSVDVRRRP